VVLKLLTAEMLRSVVVLLLLAEMLEAVLKARTADVAVAVAWLVKRVPAAVFDLRLARRRAQSIEASLADRSGKSVGCCYAKSQTKRVRRRTEASSFKRAEVLRQSITV
jgi:hypothetical protein